MDIGADDHWDIVPISSGDIHWKQHTYLIRIRKELTGNLLLLLSLLSVVAVTHFFLLLTKDFKLFIHASVNKNIGK